MALSLLADAGSAVLAVKGSLRRALDCSPLAKPHLLSLDFYIQYEYLSSRDFGTLLAACSNLADTVYSHYTKTLRGTWAQPRARPVCRNTSMSQGRI